MFLKSVKTVKSYPSAELEKMIIEIQNLEKGPLYQYIREGIDDGSIRNDMSAEGMHL